MTYAKVSVSENATLDFGPASWLPAVGENCTSNGTGNVTTESWEMVLVAETISVSLIVFFNSFVLLIYTVHSHLRTPFAVYIMLLLLSNISYSVVRGALDVINGVSQSWWTGWGSCTLYQYMNWVYTDIPVYCHMLITLNRLWAIAYPISYRNYHTKKLAVLLCCAGIAVRHIAGVPGVALDALYYRLPLKENGCQLNVVPLKDWARFNLVVIGTFPILFIVLACPLLLYKWKKSSKMVTGKSTATTTKSTSTKASIEPKTGMSRKPSVSSKGAADTNQDVKAGNSALNTTSKPTRTRGRRDAPQGYMLVVGLTISIFFCYTPIVMYFMVTSFTEVPVPDVDLIASVLYSLQAILDPILIAVMLKDLRLAVLKAITCAVSPMH